MAGQMQHFASAPQAVGARKFRNPDESAVVNLMHDRRVCRGSNHAPTLAPQPDAAELQKQREAQRRRLMRANQTKKRAGTPEPVLGRKHMDIQTDSYLEELTERTVEFEAETQTDFLLDRPPSPLFMPAKIGSDIATQIEEGELFDFDVECEPILEVLVGKTLEQAMMEVLEEEEFESLRLHQADFEKQRNAELFEVQRMEAAETRRQEELQRRIQQEQQQRELDLSIMRKVVSRSTAAVFLSSARGRAMAHLGDAGVFADGVQLAVENNFVPKLLQLVSKLTLQAAGDASLTAEVAAAVVKGGVEKHAARFECEKRRLEAIDQVERAARAEKEARLLKAAQNAERVRQEQERLAQWEAFVPEEPVPEETQVAEIDAEALTATLGDGRVAVLQYQEQAQALAAMFAGLAEGQKVVCTINTVVQDNGEQHSVVAFRVAESSEAVADEAPEGEEGG